MCSSRTIAWANGAVVSATITDNSTYSPDLSVFTTHPQKYEFPIRDVDGTAGLLGAEILSLGRVSAITDVIAAVTN